VPSCFGRFWTSWCEGLCAEDVRCLADVLLLLLLLVLLDPALVWLCALHVDLKQQEAVAAGQRSQVLWRVQSKT